MRVEFSRKTRVLAFERSKGRCESCGARLKVGEGEYDHVLPASLGGTSDLSNCQLLCVPCHRGPDGKTADDVRGIRKADRIRAKHLGAWPKSRRPIKGRGFPKRGTQ